MNKRSEEPSQNFTALFSIILVFTILFTTVLFSNIQYLNKMEQYSTSGWSVTRVKEKVTIVTTDEEVKYKLELVTHDKAKYDHLFIDQEFFKSIKDKELVQYKITGKDEVIIKQF